MIASAVKHIKEQTGINVTLDDHFSGLHTHSGELYFNIMTDKPLYISTEITKLQTLSSYSSVISRVEPCGHKRISVFLH